MSTPSTRVVFPAAAAGEGPSGPVASTTSVASNARLSFRRVHAHIISGLLVLGVSGVRPSRGGVGHSDPPALLRREVDGVDDGLHRGAVAEGRVVGRLAADRADEGDALVVLVAEQRI